MDNLPSLKSPEHPNDINQDLLNESTDWVWRATSKGVFTYLSPSLKKMTGYDPEELLGKPIEEILEKLFPKESQEAVLESLKSRETGDFGNDVISYDLIYKRKDGSEFVGEMRSSAIVNSKGERVAIQGITRDVTQQRAMLDELRKSNELFSAFFTMSSNPSVITERLSGKIVDVNPAWISSFGWSRDEAIGKTPIELDLFDDANKIKVSQNQMSISTGSTPEKSRILMQTRSGEERICLVESRLVEISGAQRAFTTITDVTDKEKIEQELLKIAKLESMGVFAGGIAHDLNNLLTAVLGNINMAQLVANKDEAQKYLSEAESATLSVHEIVQQLLTFATGGEPVREILNLEELIENSVSFSLHGSHTIAKLDIAGDLWQVTADRAQLGQVINNLIINAKQAMTTKGTIFISARNIQIDAPSNLTIEPGPYVQVTVRDEGLGIPEDIMQYIFDPFYTTKAEGSGLGLPSCYSILNKHNGCITVTSEAGEGASFDFYLPVNIQRSESASRNTKRKMQSTEGRVLIMDDSAQIRHIASSFVQNLGFEVVTCNDGEEAIASYTAAMDSGTPFAAVVLDLTIPGGMGGTEAIEKLREFDPDVKAIVSSGYSDDSAMANYADFGFSAAIPKPYRFKEFGDVLRNVISDTIPGN